MSELDIVSLIEQNPITKLSGNYHNKLITQIKDKFNDSQQQMFVASFYCFLNCDKKNDFIIDLDNVWKWLGFSQKVRAKELLNKSFILDKDYKKSLSLQGKQTKHTKGGQLIYNNLCIYLIKRNIQLFYFTLYKHFYYKVVENLVIKKFSKTGYF